LRFLHLAELEARLVAEHAAALEDLGPNHRGTAMLRDLLDKARKERQEAQRALTRPQRQQLLTAAQPTGPGVLLHSLEQQLKQLEAELGPGHRQVNDLRRRVEAVRQFMKDLQQDLQSATTAPSTAPAPK
jgi:chromosome segregation ATPase